MATKKKAAKKKTAKKAPRKKAAKKATAKKKAIKKTPLRPQAPAEPEAKESPAPLPGGAPKPDPPWDPADGLQDAGTAPAIPEPPRPEETQQVLAERPEHTASQAAHRALRFMAKDESLVVLYPSMIIGPSRRGTIYHPWNLPGLPDNPVVVDGRQLYRILKMLGEYAYTSINGGRLVLESAPWKYTLPTVNEVPTVPSLPTDLTGFVGYEPSTFNAAAAFVGKHDIEPATLSGVHVSAAQRFTGATNRHAMFYAAEAHTPPFTGVFPPDAFADLGETLWVKQDATEVWIGVATTGEYRRVNLIPGETLDMTTVANNSNPAFYLELDSAWFKSLLKEAVVVQRRAAPIQFKAYGDGGQVNLEVTAGGVTTMKAHVRVAAFTSEAGLDPYTWPAEYKWSAAIAGETLRRISDVCPDKIRIGVPADPTMPLTVVVAPRQSVVVSTMRISDS